MTTDFLNRVRLNVVPGYQVFAPIAFYEFDKRVTSEQHGALFAAGGALPHNGGECCMLDCEQDLSCRRQQ